MNPKVKSKWVKALRSGKYKQDKGTLKSGKGYCCLGVLTDLYIKEKKLKIGWKAETSILGSKIHRFKDQATFLPSVVKKWAGIAEKNPSVGGKTLATHNDGIIGMCYMKPKTFKQIAKLIEKEL